MSYNHRSARYLKGLAGLVLTCGCLGPAAAEPIKAFCIDFNWGEGGPNGFAKPGLWAEASPAAHVAWYEQLGANVIQTFAVSCNGFAWYRGGKVPAQPGLQHDFLPEVVKLGHARRMRVFGYFCIAANTRWGREHPDLSYGIPSAYHIPFTSDYLDFLGQSIEEALRLSQMDGFMVDWLWNPSDEARQKANGGRWLECERKLFEELMKKPFPPNGPSKDDRLAYERLAIERCWRRIHDTAKRVKPDCILWLSCNQVLDPTLEGASVLREVDWMMDESGTPQAMQKVAPRLGQHTRQLLCLAGWGDRHQPRRILADAANASYGIYGFTKPNADSLPLPIAKYLSQPIESFAGNDRSIATLARFFTGRPFDSVTSAQPAK